jgi:hypothetical protein
VLKKARIVSIAAATLLSSPAFAVWSLAQAAQPSDGERIIREVVINGRLIEGDRDESPTNELRPVPVGPAKAALLIAGLNPHGEDVTCSSRSFGQLSSRSGWSFCLSSPTG